ncbi:MAG: ATP-binding cassette domain-containing protein [Bacteroidales bacterium]|nr:ATP-binding cassette domain-containing protein [Bacteroidales bacterium]
MVQIKNIELIGGENFSGRSAYLREKNCDNNSRKRLFIGEIPSNYLSGLTTTVDNEIRLHRANNNQQIIVEIDALLKKCDFDKHLFKNSFNLSGGEQALLAVACHLLIDKDDLAIDTVLEQLSSSWILHLFDTFRKLPHKKIMISDNRIKSYGFEPDMILQHNNDKPLIDSKKFQINTSEDINFLLDDISFSYSRFQNVLTNFTYEFETGKIYLLNGKNGAGKTTLAKILSGVLKLKHGKIYKNGLIYVPYSYPGKIVGYSFQDPDEQLFANTVFRELNGNVDSLKANMLAKSFGLSDFMEEHPQDLPFVLRKRLAIAATLSIDRSFYIFDEPTLGQDDNTSKELAKIFHKLTTGGKGVIIISHFKEFILEYDSIDINLS